MGSGLKGVGKQSDWLEMIIAQGHNPLFALFGAVLVTSIVQSSSFTTSLIITLVAAGQMPIETAVFGRIEDLDFRKSPKPGSADQAES